LCDATGHCATSVATTLSNSAAVIWVGCCDEALQCVPGLLLAPWIVSTLRSAANSSYGLCTARFEMC